LRSSKSLLAAGCPGIGAAFRRAASHVDSEVFASREEAVQDKGSGLLPFDVPLLADLLATGGEGASTAGAAHSAQQRLGKAALSADASHEAGKSSSGPSLKFRNRRAATAALQPPRALTPLRLASRRLGWMPAPLGPPNVGHGAWGPGSESWSETERATFLAAFKEESIRQRALAEREAAGQVAPSKELAAQLVGEWESLSAGKLHVYLIRSDGEGRLWTQSRQIGRSAPEGAAGDVAEDEIWEDAEGKVLWSKGNGSVTLDRSTLGSIALAWHLRNGNVLELVRRRKGTAAPSEPEQEPPRPAEAVAEVKPHGIPAERQWSGWRREKALRTVANRIIDAWLQSRGEGRQLVNLKVAAAHAQQGRVVAVAAVLAHQEDLIARSEIHFAGKAKSRTASDQPAGSPQEQPPAQPKRRRTKLTAEERRHREDALLSLMADGEALDWKHVRTLLVSETPQK